MFGLFKRRRKKENQPAPPPEPASSAPVAPVAPPRPPPAPKPPSPPAPNHHALSSSAKQPASPAGGPDGARGLSLPLNAIVKQFPSEIQDLVVRPPGPEVQITLPLQPILEQLPRGSVKVTLKQLRHCAPQGTFAVTTQRDETLVEVPLAEVLPRLESAHLKLRPEQKEVTSPADIGPIFGPHGEGASLSTPAPASNRDHSHDREHGHGTPQQAATPASAPVPIPAHTSPAAHSEPEPEPAPAPEHSPVPIKMTGNRDEVHLSIPLASLKSNWPEPIRRELEKPDLAEAVLKIPLSEIEQTLKRGKILFNWQILRTWIRPPLANTVASSQDETLLELPLKLVVPVFLAKRKPASNQKQVTVSEEIPDLFYGSENAPSEGSSSVPPPEQTPPAESAGSSTGSTSASPITPAVAPATAEAPAPIKAPSKLASEASTAQNDSSPGQRSPDDMVQQASELPGVAGALIATLDGLKIASRLPAPLSGDLVAAFLPQVFSRMTHYAKETKLGVPKTLTVEMDNYIWYLNKSDEVYFTALGQPDQSLPTDRLRSIAGQLAQSQAQAQS